MTTTSATSQIVSALGGGSGIDMAGLAKSLAEAQFAGRIDRISTQSQTLDRQISAASTLKSQVLQLASSVGDRVRNGDLSAQPSIANGAVASVSRGTASGKGTYSLEVLALAKGQTLTSPAYAASTAPVGAGTLTLKFGTISGAGFTEDTAQAPVTLTIASGTTLSQLAAQINGANAGVSAYVANGADGAHLMLKGKDGASNGFVLEATEVAGEEGLAQVAWAPGQVGDRLLGTAQNASFKLDGLSMSSTANTLTDVVPGLNLTLTGTNSGAPTTISFSDPAAGVTTFMQDLTSALNELATELNKQVDAKTGELSRDSGARALRAELSRLAGSVVIPGAADGAPATLADLGLATNRDGTFRLDTNRLNASMKASPEGVAAMFTTGLFGVYATLDRLSRNTTATTNPGSLGGSISRYSSRKTQLTDDQTKLADKQEALRARLSTQFAGVDSRVSASRSTLSFLQNQIDAWNNAKN